jgi:fumarate reductase subunit D
MAEEMGHFDERYNPGYDVIRVEASRKDPEVILEPLFWAVFSAGGFLTAFLLPVTILAISFFVPLGLWPATRLSYGWLSSSLSMSNFWNGLAVRGFFFVLIGGSLFHGAHRFKYVLMEAGARQHETALGIVLYGLAIVGTLTALYYCLLGWLF